MKKKVLLFFAVSAMACLTANAFTYYWVGGTENSDPLTNQNWGDVGNWILNPLDVNSHPGQLPTDADDIVFYAHSFGTTAASQKVIVTAGGRKCRNLTFITSGADAVTCNPVLEFQGSLDVYGSLKFKPGMQVTASQASNQLNFVSLRAADTINFNGVVVQPNVQISGDTRYTVIGDFLLQQSPLATRTGQFVYSNSNSLVINGNLTARNISWGDGNAATKDSLTVTGNLTLYCNYSGSNPAENLLDNATAKPSFSQGGTLTVGGNITVGIFTFSYSEEIVVGSGTLTADALYYNYNTKALTVDNYKGYSVLSMSNNGGGLSITGDLLPYSTTTATYRPAITFINNNGGISVGGSLHCNGIVATDNGNATAAVGDGGISVTGNIYSYSGSAINFTNNDGGISAANIYGYHATSPNSYNSGAVNFQRNKGGINITGDMRCTGITYGYRNSYGFGTTAIQTDETMYTLNNATTLANVTAENNTGNLTVGGNLTSGFCLFSSSTSDSISVGGTWTATGYVIFVSNGNVRIGTSFIGYDFYSHGSGNITVGQPGYTGEVFRAATFSSPCYYGYSYEVPFRSNTIRIIGTGTKTFNGSVNSIYSTSFSNGTVNINGSLNVQADYHYSSGYCDKIYRSLINAGCQLTVTGSVTAGTVAAPAANGAIGSWFCVEDAATRVSIAGNFTQAGLIIYNGETTIGGVFTAKGSYGTSDCPDIADYGLRVNDGLLTLANPQTITTTGNILIQGGIWTNTVPPSVINCAQSFSSTGGTLNGIGNTEINLGYSWNYSGSSTVYLNYGSTTPKWIKCQNGGFTARSGDKYTWADFWDYGSSSVSTVHPINAGNAHINRITVEKGTASYGNVDCDTLVILSHGKQSFGVANVKDSLRIRANALSSYEAVRKSTKWPKGLNGKG